MSFSSSTQIGRPARACAVCNGAPPPVSALCVVQANASFPETGFFDMDTGSPVPPPANLAALQAITEMCVCTGEGWYCAAERGVYVVLGDGSEAWWRIPYPWNPWPPVGDPLDCPTVVWESGRAPNWRVHFESGVPDATPPSPGNANMGPTYLAGSWTGTMAEANALAAYGTPCIENPDGWPPGAWMEFTDGPGRWDGTQFVPTTRPPGVGGPTNLAWSSSTPMAGNPQPFDFTAEWPVGFSANPATDSWVIDWGDGSPPQTVTGVNANGGRTVSHTYATGGVYPMTAQYQRSGVPIAVSNFPNKVAVSGPMTFAPPLTSGVPSPYTTSTVLKTDVPIPAGSALLVNWGDGQLQQITTGVADLNGPGIRVEHTYATNGSFQPTANVNAPINNPGFPTQFGPVANTNLNPVVLGGPTLTFSGPGTALVNESKQYRVYASVDVTNAGSWYRVDWGDGTFDNVTAAVAPAGTFTYMNHAFTAPGTYQPLIQLFDGATFTAVTGATPMTTPVTVTVT